MLSRNNCLEELMIDSGPLLKSLYLKSGSLLPTLPLSHCTYPIGVILSSHFLYTSKSFPVHIYTSSQSFMFFESRLVAKWSLFQFWRDHLFDLISLKIEDCPNFVAFPSGGLPAPNLIQLIVNKCQRLNSMPTNMHRLLHLFNIWKSEIVHNLSLFQKVVCHPI